MLLVKISKEAGQLIGFLAAMAGVVVLYSRAQYVAIFNNVTLGINPHLGPWSETQVMLVGALLTVLGLYLFLKAR